MNKVNEQNRLVAIVGRPNVGKSTLFNRLVGKRQAITQDQEGTTRDRNYGLVEWCGKRFTLVDTGGYTTAQGEGYSDHVNQHIDLACEEADLILFLVDCQVGIHPLDEEMAHMLKKREKKILIVPNKSDNYQIGLNAHSFYELGLDAPIYEVSSIHGSGTGDLLDAVFANLPEISEVPEEEEGLPRITLVGQPNVGKSTLLNALLGEERMITDRRPHTTRDAIDTYYDKYEKRFVITDTAGIRKKRIHKDVTNLYATIRSIRAIQRSDVVLLLLDATQGLTRQDQRLLQLAWRYHKGVMILVNKWDLIENKTDKSLQSYQKKLQEELGNLKSLPILFISAIEKKRIYQAIDQALIIYANRKKHIPTNALNRVLLKAVAKTPPPSKRGKQVGIKYVMQLPAPTPMFAFFTNCPSCITPAYKGFLEKQIRQYFSLQGVPITIIIREKKK